MKLIFFFLVEDFATPATSTWKHVAFWIIIILFFGCAFGACFNVFMHNKRGLEAVPGLEKSIKMALTLKFVKDSVKNKFFTIKNQSFFKRLGTKLTNFNQIHFNALKGTNSEPEESEFKIENLSEIQNKNEKSSKYGSIS